MTEWLTTEEVAKILRVNNETILRWIKRKQLKAYKAGNMWRIRKTDVDAFLRGDERK